ncbi:MAG: flagellar assembly protein FliW [Deltaproteobacteria bacterium]|nr:flagellar assembly protein FliW [Deltaproteobacteria bacterium]
MKIIKTIRFGEIEVDEGRAIHFKDGLPGFSDKRDFIILEHKPGSPFMWLQSMEIPDLAFVMINPFLLKDDYLQNLSPEEETLMKAENDEEIIIYSLVTIPRGHAEKATVNLMGPIVIGSGSRNAKQVILANSEYSHCHPMNFG